MINVSAGIPQRSILGPLLSKYINDLSYGLSSTSRLFADDTFLFLVVHEVIQSTGTFNDLNDDLDKISIGAYQKMSFNPDKSKHAKEDIFSRKTHRVSHSPATLNNVPVVCNSCQKNLSVYIDEKLSTFHIMEIEQCSS